MRALSSGAVADPLADLTLSSSLTQSVLSTSSSSSVLLLGVAGDPPTQSAAFAASQPLSASPTRHVNALSREYDHVLSSWISTTPLPPRPSVASNGSIAGDSDDLQNMRLMRPPRTYTRDGDSQLHPQHDGYRFLHYGPEWAVGSVSSLTAALNLFNAIAGVGLLCLTYSFVMTGIPLGTIFLSVMGLGTGYSLYLLHKVSVFTQQLSYGQMALKVSGPYFYLVVDTFNLLQTLGLMFAFLIAIHGFLDVTTGETEQKWSSAVFGWDGMPLVPLANGVVLAVISNILLVDSSNYTSLTGLVYLFIICVFTTIDVASYPGGSTSTFAKCQPDAHVMKALPFIASAFSCTYQFMPIYSELPQPVSDFAARRLITIPLLITTSLYILISSFGCILYGEYVSTQFFWDETERTAPIIRASELCIAIALELKFPTLFHSFLKSVQFLYRIMSKTETISYLRSLQETKSVIINTSPPSRSVIFLSSLGLVALSFCTAFFAPRMNEIVAVIGGLCVVPMNLVFPPLMYLATIRKASWRDKILPGLHVVFGIVMWILALVGMVLNLVFPNKLAACVD